MLFREPDWIKLGTNLKNTEHKNEDSDAFVCGKMGMYRVIEWNSNYNTGKPQYKPHELNANMKVKP